MQNVDTDIAHMFKEFKILSINIDRFLYIVSELIYKERSVGMKKIVIFSLVLALCCFSSITYAASIGNKIEPIGQGKFAVTAEGNFVFDRDMESKGSSTSGSTVTSLEVEKMNQEYAKLILGVTDNINIFAKLGVTELRDLQAKFSTGEDVDADFDNDFLYGGGFNAVIKLGDNEEFFMGLNGDFSFFEADTEDLTISDNTVTNVSGEGEVTEIQVGGYAGMRLDISDDIVALPYLGVFYNHFNLDADAINYTIGGTNYVLNIDSDGDDEFGIAVGTDVNITENFSLNVEGRFIAGTAVSFGGTFKF